MRKKGAKSNKIIASNIECKGGNVDENNFPQKC